MEYWSCVFRTGMLADMRYYLGPHGLPWSLIRPPEVLGRRILTPLYMMLYILARYPLAPQLPPAKLVANIGKYRISGV